MPPVTPTAPADPRVLLLEQRLQQQDTLLSMMNQTVLDLSTQCFVFREQLDLLLESNHVMRLSNKSIEEVISNVVCAHFGITYQQLRGEREKRKPGRQSMLAQQHNFLIDNARQWFMCLLRQLTNQTFHHLRVSFPWLQTRHYHRAGQLLDEMSRSKTHEESGRWRELLQLVVAEGRRQHVDVTNAVDELRYA